MQGAAGRDPDLMTLQQYVSDMLALETHIEQTLDGQRQVVRDHPAAALATQRFESISRTQREALRQHLNDLGGPPDTGGLMGTAQALVKNSVTTATGIAAGAINAVRTQRVAKALRDDYTAFSHAIVGYAMLATTASLLEHEPSAALAERHLQAWEGAIEEIAGLIPEVVSWELRRDGRMIDDQRISSAAERLTRTWRVPEESDSRAA